MKELIVQRPLIDFFFDKDFDKQNPKSMYSRSITPWGGSLRNETVAAAVLAGTVKENSDDYKEMVEEGDQKGVDSIIREQFIMDHLYDQMER